MSEIWKHGDVSRESQTGQQVVNKTGRIQSTFIFPNIKPDKWNNHSSQDEEQYKTKADNM